MSTSPTVLLTDHPWPELDIEREIIESAGYQLVAGPRTAFSPEAVDAMVAAANPTAIMTCWAVVSEREVAAPAKLTILARLGVGLDNMQSPRRRRAAPG